MATLPETGGITFGCKKGVLAQLVERFNGIEEVSGSTPLHSTFSSELQVIWQPDSLFRVAAKPHFPGGEGLLRR